MGTARRDTGTQARDDHGDLHRHADRRQLQQIIAGLSEGVILVEPDRSTAWANGAGSSNGASPEREGTIGGWD